MPPLYPQVAVHSKVISRRRLRASPSEHRGIAGRAGLSGPANGFIWRASALTGRTRQGPWRCATPVGHTVRSGQQRPPGPLGLTQLPVLGSTVGWLRSPPAAGFSVDCSSACCNCEFISVTAAVAGGLAEGVDGGDPIVAVVDSPAFTST